MFHRIAIWRVFAMLDFSTFQRNPPKPAIPRVSEPRFGFEVACISVQCDVELRQRADANAQAPDTLESISGRVSRGLQSSLVGQGRTVRPLVIPGAWRPRPKDVRTLL